jgi:hypothetical protein
MAAGCPGHGRRKVFVEISINRVGYMARKVLLATGARILQAEPAVDNAYIGLPCPTGKLFATDYQIVVNIGKPKAN